MGKPAQPALDPDRMQTRRWLLSGRVQGVGFRPFVYRLACAHGLCGWVRNRLGQVEIVAQGETTSLQAFAHDLVQAAPPLATPTITQDVAAQTQAFDGFEIRSSETDQAAHIHLPPDYFACADCIADVNDADNRRYRYPFTNCTQCGPRYTLIEALPYDRINTSMADFELCRQCAGEYQDPMDRRFHAQPVACPACGPHLRFATGTDTVSGDEAALRATIAALRQGRIVAIKGVGGYHLCCDATDDAAVRRLRRRKQRPHKPLAVMFPGVGTDDLALLEAAVNLNPKQRALLLSPARPIVLTQRRTDCSLSPLLAPGLNELGVMLPYSPLHHLLLQDYGAPLVMTSGNLSGEPVLTDNQEAGTRLGNIADAFLHHNRPIVRPADDSVYRYIGKAMRPLRLGRGCAPLELRLPIRLDRPTLALGAHLKNTLALAWEDRVVISPHIGDMDSRRSLAVMAQLAEDLQNLYQVQAQQLVCDAHPDYSTSRWAREQALPCCSVFHHQAHASALAGEVDPQGPWLMFTWDGTGLGEDGTLWGGEALLGEPGSWHRVASLRPFRLPGGDKSGRQPWRSAAALCWEIGASLPYAPKDVQLLQQAWRKDLHCPQSSAAGRLFDAAASLLGLTQETSFEAQGPMQLETIADHTGQAITLPLQTESELLRVDWSPLVHHLLDPQGSVAQRAADLHATLARSICDQALAVARQANFKTIGLCGGVFQNARLTALTLDALQAQGFTVQLPRTLPANDAAISFGQIIETAARQPQEDS